MAECGAQDAVSELLRLRVCPGCDYSLETLPGEGICPECGRKYDQRFIVLNGVGRGQQDQREGGTWRGMAGNLLSVGIVLAIFVFDRRLYRDPQMLGWGAIAAIILAMQLYARLFSARAPQMQLWASEDGIAQTMSTPESRRVQMMAAKVNLLFLPITLMAFAFDFHFWAGEIAAGAIMAVTVGVIGWHVKRQGDREKAQGVDYVPTLWPWERLERMEVKEVRGERMRVRCQMMQTWWRYSVNNKWVVNIDVKCSAEMAERIGALLESWRVKKNELVRRRM
jgi:hypothetical protein